MFVIKNKEGLFRGTDGNFYPLSNFSNIQWYEHWMQCSSMIMKLKGCEAKNALEVLKEHLESDVELSILSDENKELKDQIDELMIQVDSLTILNTNLIKRNQELKQMFELPLKMGL